MELPWKLPLLLDGATGTTLLGAGMPADACVEDWVLSHPDVLLELQTAYAGAAATCCMPPPSGPIASISAVMAWRAASGR